MEFWTMQREYAGVTTRFLSKNERLILSAEEEMPLVIEANGSKDSQFLQEFLATHSQQILQDIANYGAVLLRGFEIQNEEDFEKTILSIQGLQGISEAFMSEEGRIHVDHLKYVLHTNAIYKTGGTLYLGGFHSENYYSPDVPSYICFCCFKPSLRGGETGLINMEKVYRHLDLTLKDKLEKKSFFVSKWLISEVADRYQTNTETVEKICQQFDLPMMGHEDEKFILMYKPSIFVHPETKRKSLQINLFELATLNRALRKHFIADYQGKEWFWHRIVWRLPTSVFSVLEFLYLAIAPIFYSPKNALKSLTNKLRTFKAGKKNKLSHVKHPKVGSCFTEPDVQSLAKLLRNYYCSCLWKSGDILLVDNRQVVHAGMPGAGPRLIRAMICNPIEMKYSQSEHGCIDVKTRQSESIGFYIQNESDFKLASLTNKH